MTREAISLEDLSRGVVSPTEALTHVGARAAEIRRLNAFTEIRAEALGEARRGAAGKLAGVPVALKDMFVVGDRAPTAGSNVHGTWLRGTAAVVERLRSAGAVIAAFTNLHEWALGTTSVTTATGPIRNPWDPERVAGGSSGGSAVAVACGAVPIAVGTDAGGSIRVPAACCGIVGLKPTWGRVPFDGFIEGTDGPPIDHIGPLARSVAEARALYEVLAQVESKPVRVGELRVGVAEGFFARDVAAEMLDALGSALRDVVSGLVGSSGAVVVEDVEFAGQAVAALLLPHSARLLAMDLVERPEAFQPATLRVLALGQALSGQDELDASLIRRRVLAAWNRVFQDVDVVITPTLPAAPCTIEHRTVELLTGTSSADLAYTAFNSPMNLAGVPCLTLPVGSLPSGLPFNVSLTARQGREDALFALGEAIERETERRFAERVAPG